MVSTGWCCYSVSSVASVFSVSSVASVSSIFGVVSSIILVLCNLAGSHVDVFYRQS